MKQFLTFFIFLFLIQFSSAQSKTVTGLVVDDQNIPLIGVNVIEIGTNNGVVTNFDGEYSIVVNSPSSVLSFSYLGFQTIEIPVEQQNTIKVTLTKNTSALDEVVVVGYGTRKVSDLTGAVGSISSNRLENKPNANVIQALQGAVPGVNITQNGGGAEQGNNSILIRGRNSITAGNGPLIVLDGVPYSGNLSDINTQDVKSMTVLKDASSTAIYGSRGANGVIIIETKKGQVGKVRISYSGYYGVQELTNLPELYDGPGFAAFKDARLAAEGLDPENRLTPSELEVLNAGEAVDWLDLTTRTGKRQDHNIAISGGSDRTKYYVSLGYHDAEGVTLNDGFTRYSLRVNVNFDITDNIKFGTATQLSRIDRSGNNPNFGSQRNGAFRMNPLTTAFDENGDPTVYPWPEDIFVWNPLAPTLEVNDDFNNKVFTNNYLQFSFPFLEGLSYKINTGIEYDQRDIGEYEGRNTGSGFETNGSARIDFRKDENYLIENILSYTKEFGDHSFDFTGLYSTQVIENYRSVTEASGFVSDALTYYQMDNSTSGAVNDTDFEKTQLISQMARLNYGYLDRYLLTATVRRDGYSGFGADKKYGVFPSLALGWIISDEAFFKSGPVNYTKLRASYGVNGNQAVGPYDNLATLTTRPWVIGSATAPGFFVDRLANSELGWEQTSTLNVGLDFGFLENRFQLSADAYIARTKDLLLNRLVPSVNGVNRVIENIGEVENRGLELVAQGFIINGDKFTWNFKGNVAWNKNEIVSLFGDKQDDVANQWFIGQPIRVNYDYAFDGIWQEGDNIENSAQPDAQPGYIRVLDVANDLDDEGNPILAIDPANDRIIQGQRDPKVVYGLENTLNYGNLSLYVFLQGVGGVTKSNPYKDVAVGGDVRNNWIAQEFWTPENPINTYYSIDPEANDFDVDFYEDASFLRVRDITLSYKFDNKLFGNSALNGLQLYSTIRNLATFTKYGALDPEFNDQFDTPLQQEFIFGLKFNVL
ncbi:TonB-dependent receptor [Gramella sp. AN32]|uniref:SusC/RagA family TonB-linked outer membrane protein n=1 Tax=Christiangramia antarctica TaxID=2058158 RepID=A0ABW5X1L6_9FLAO|nr:TonB-dependent receptor [Gramella sp. AN32]MCM4156716.1 SusC/RagA family TonB-linked outer membrane protein [Gramella sp. AN32]